MQEALPKAFTTGAKPNPFVDILVINYQLPQKAHVTVEILDVTGRVINTLVNEPKEPGCYSIVWHGKNKHGRTLPAGIYFYRIKAGKNCALRKIIKLK